MHDDSISDVLRLAQAQSVASGGFVAGGLWALRFPPPDKLKFFAVVRGGAWLLLDGETMARRLDDGDVVLLCAATGFTLASEPALPAEPASRYFADAEGRLVEITATADTMMIGGHVRLDPDYAPVLHDALAPLIHVRADAEQAAALRWLFDRLVSESMTPQPGSELVKAQLAQLLFVEVLRAYLGEGMAIRASWLRAAADRRLAPVMRQLHAAPAYPWRLEELAGLAAMSRSAFASHFKTMVGQAPMSYLTQWRMRLAQQQLRQGEVAIGALAARLGYASDSAFSHAFKRVVGCAPAHYLQSLRD